MPFSAWRKKSVNHTSKIINDMVLQLLNTQIGYTTTVPDDSSSGSKSLTFPIINSTLHEGEFVSLVGRNGCGKSTLLRTLAGMQPTLGGEITYFGKSLDAYSLRERARLLSIVTPATSPDPSMTVFDLVALGRSPYTGFWGSLSSEDRSLIAESLETVGMSDYVNRLASKLSDGERQKVLIAKALAQQTPVILLDEPTSFLDYPSKISTMRILRDLAHNHHKTILLSTHDLEQATKFSDTIWLLDKQSGLTVGTPSQLISQGILARTLDFTSNCKL